jgi:hypothetical protein
VASRQSALSASDSWQWRSGCRLDLIVHHNDAKHEYAYDRDSHIGKLARGLDEGPGRGWVIVSKKNDWKAIYAEK